MNKKTIMLLLLLCFTLPGRSQQREFLRLFERYCGGEEVTAIEMSGRMLRLTHREALEKSDDKELTRLLDGIHSIRIMVSQAPAPELVARMQALTAPPSRYELLTSLSEGGRTTRFYFIDGDERTPSELLMYAWGEGETIAIDIYGYFRVEQVSQLAAMGLPGFEEPAQAPAP